MDQLWNEDKMRYQALCHEKINAATIMIKLAFFSLKDKNSAENKCSLFVKPLFFQIVFVNENFTNIILNKINKK